MGGFAEYGQYDAVGLARLVRRKEIAPRELLEEALERAARVNPKLNAIVHRDGCGGGENRGRDRSSAAVRGRAIPRQGHRACAGGRAAYRRQPAVRELCAGGRRGNNPALQARGPRHLREDQSPRVRPPSGDRARAVRPLPQSLGFGPHAWRIERRDRPRRSQRGYCPWRTATMAAARSASPRVAAACSD